MPFLQFIILKHEDRGTHGRTDIWTYGYRMDGKTELYKMLTEEEKGRTHKRTDRHIFYYYIIWLHSFEYSRQ